MLYQKLLTGANPYFVSLGAAKAFEVHCHPEIELSYCVRGEYKIKVENREYLLKSGDLAFVKPLAAHELCGECSDNCLRLTIELGTGLLGETFELFNSVDCQNVVFELKNKSDSPEFLQLAELFDATAQLICQKPDFYDIDIRGNLYKISGGLLRCFSKKYDADSSEMQSVDTQKIQDALKLIYERYTQPLSLDWVSAYCGYSKSNFCKVFKSVTGESFHSMLNRHRVDIACLQLTDKSKSIENIALSVGFCDTKSFCRVFKKVMGKSAGKYRRAL